MSKNARVAFVIEEEIDDIFERLAAKLGKSKSGYMRELIINEIRSQGLLPEELAVRLLSRA